MYMKTGSAKSESVKGRAGRTTTAAMTRRAALLAVFFISIVTGGCGGRDASIESRRAYRSIVGESLKLYTGLHPLRSSRLGISGSDSLLFTFSEKEIASCCAGCDSLLARMSTLPAAHFDSRDTEDSAILIDWLRGELFALRELRAWKTNPLLYCWMIEEALFGIPSRIEAPVTGEFRSYERRLSLLPRLLENAEVNLENPAQIHLGLSTERIGSILENTRYLRGNLTQRYGSAPSSFDGAIAGVERFRDFLRDQSVSSTPGSFILGTEKISDILLFSEHLDLDLDKFTAEADQSIRKNMSQIASIGRNRSFVAKNAGKAENPGAQALVDSIGRIASSERIFVSEKEAFLPVVIKAILPLQRILSPNPYLSVPAGEPATILSISTTSFAGNPCGTVIVVPPQEERTDPEGFVYRLIGVSACVSEPDRALCGRGDTLRTLLASELFTLGWKYLVMKDLCQLFPDPGMSLRKKLLEDTSRDMAMMVTVFGLHSGRLTIDSAVEYLVATLGIDRGDAAAKVSVAAASPSAAYPGIAVILIEQMLRDASNVRGERQPRTRIRGLMLEEAALPLPMVGRRMEK